VARDKKQELVEVAQPQARQLMDPRSLALLAPKSWDMEYTPGAYITTLPTDTMSGKIAVYNHLSASTRLWDEVDTVVEVSHILLSSCEKKVDDEGEIGPGIATTLIDVDGKAHRTTSVYAYRQLALMMTLIGAPPWSPPLRIMPRRLKAADSGRYYLSLGLVE
jgi:hypothetical protein